MRPPLFITCRRPGCEAIRQVKSLTEQRKGGFCSHRCAALHTRNMIAYSRKGVVNSAAARRRRLMDRIEGLTALDAYRLGYRMGLQSKYYKQKRPDAVQAGSP